MKSLYPKLIMFPFVALCSSFVLAGCQGAEQGSDIDRAVTSHVDNLYGADIIDLHWGNQVESVSGWVLYELGEREVIFLPDDAEEIRPRLYKANYFGYVIIAQAVADDYKLPLSIFINDLPGSGALAELLALTDYGDLPVGDAVSDEFSECLLDLQNSNNYDLLQSLANVLSQNAPGNDRDFYMPAFILSVSNAETLLLGDKIWILKDDDRCMAIAGVSLNNSDSEHIYVYSWLFSDDGHVDFEIRIKVPQNQYDEGRISMMLRGFLSSD